jgi:hypothetical protein
VTGTEDAPAVVKRRAQQLRETLTELGPSFIKAGQVLANRPDIVREDYMNELCTLQVGVWGGEDVLQARLSPVNVLDCVYCGWSLVQDFYATAAELLLK